MTPLVAGTVEPLNLTLQGSPPLKVPKRDNGDNGPSSVTPKRLSRTAYQMVHDGFVEMYGS